MTDIPEDIQAIAAKIVVEIGADWSFDGQLVLSDYEPEQWRVVDEIARAILAERGRCAKLCDDMHFRLVSNRSGRRAAVAYDLAIAIRTPKTTLKITPKTLGAA